MNDVRAQELVETGASRIATACPFCYIMIDDGVKGEGVEDSEVKVGDIALHLLEALESAKARAWAPVTALFVAIVYCRRRRLWCFKRSATGKDGPDAAEVQRMLARVVDVVVAEEKPQALQLRVVRGARRLGPRSRST